jgi:hypothetical protein
LLLSKKQEEQSMVKKVRVTDVDTLRRLIDEAEGKAQVRCLSPKTIANAVEGWEHKVFSPPLSRLRGCTMTVQASGAKFAKAYNGIPMETVAVLQHDTVGWYLESVERRPVKSHSWRIEVEMTEAMREWVLEHAARGC